MDLHIPRGLSPEQTQFLCLLAVRPSLRRADYQHLIRVSYATAKRHLSQLAAAGLIIPVGRTRDRLYALSPLAVAAPNSQRNCAGDATDPSRMTGSDSTHIRISIDPIAIDGRHS